MGFDAETARAFSRESQRMEWLHELTQIPCGNDRQEDVAG
jgi:hypothetical protein